MLILVIKVQLKYIFLQMHLYILYIHELITICQYVTTLMNSFVILEILYNKYSKIMVINIVIVI